MRHQEMLTEKVPYTKTNSHQMRQQKLTEKEPTTTSCYMLLKKIENNISLQIKPWLWKHQKQTNAGHKKKKTHQQHHLLHYYE